MTAVRDHRWFLAVLTVGLALRVAMTVAFYPAFVVSDAPVYLRFVQHPSLSANRPAGYDSFLWLLHQLTPALALVAGVQHLLGLATAVMIYALLRRRGVSDPVAALAALPVLTDAMQLMLEHTPLSDVLFEVLLVAGIAVLGWWRRPTRAAYAVGSLLLGLACLVRVAGQPVLVAVVLFCLWTSPTARRRAVAAAVAVAAFVLPLVGYAALYHHERGAWATAEAGGRSLYMRTTGFVDCARLVGLPSYERVLCPAEPVGRRADPTTYGWFRPDHTAGMTPPPGVTLDAAFRDFGERAIRAQPLDYLAIVARDTAMTFGWRRDDAAEYDTAAKWKLETYADGPVTARARAAYTTYGGTVLRPREPLASLLAGYGRHVYLRGTLMLVLAVVAAWGLVRRPADGEDDRRPLVMLALTVGVGMLLVPVVSPEVIWRYVLPGVALLPLAAATGIRSTTSAVRRPGPHRAVSCAAGCPSAGRRTPR